MAGYATAHAVTSRLVELGAAALAADRAHAVGGLRRPALRTCSAGAPPKARGREQTTRKPQLCRAPRAAARDAPRSHVLRAARMTLLPPIVTGSNLRPNVSSLFPRSGFSRARSVVHRVADSRGPTLLSPKMPLTAHCHAKDFGCLTRWRDICVSDATDGTELLGERN